MFAWGPPDLMADSESSYNTDVDLTFEYLFSDLVTLGTLPFTPPSPLDPPGSLGGLPLQINNFTLFL